jgi:hypothetical protein
MLLADDNGRISQRESALILDRVRALLAPDVEERTRWRRAGVLPDLRLIGPRTDLRQQQHGEFVAKSFFYRCGDRAVWQWQAFNQDGVIMQVCEIYYTDARDQQSALWRLRDMASWHCRWDVRSTLND